MNLKPLESFYHSAHSSPKYKQRATQGVALAYLP